MPAREGAEITEGITTEATEITENKLSPLAPLPLW